MSHATAVYTRLSSTRALVEVTYSTGDFGLERVEVRPGRSLYDACYRVASRKASFQGDRLERFSSATP